MLHLIVRDRVTELETRQWIIGSNIGSFLGRTDVTGMDGDGCGTGHQVIDVDLEDAAGALYEVRMVHTRTSWRFPSSTQREVTASVILIASSA
jgi:hypothetical protein